MEILNEIRRAIQACAQVIGWGVGLQTDARKQLVEQMQTICIACDEAFETVLEGLLPIKQSFADPHRLADELRRFAADRQLRGRFKPERLCGQIDRLLVELASNLDPLKYSVDCRRIQDIRDGLFRSRDVDMAIRAAYDVLAEQLDTIAGQIGDPAFNTEERAKYAQRVIQQFESDLRAALTDLRQAKADVLGIAPPIGG